MHLEYIPLDAREWPPSVRSADRLLQTLRERLADVLLYRQLATLRRDVPLQESLDDLRYRGPDAARVSELFAGAAEAPRPVEPPSTLESA